MQRKPLLLTAVIYRGVKHYTEFNNASDIDFAVVSTVRRLLPYSARYGKEADAVSEARLEC
jgi:predicted nucleotidyltransferase